MRVVLFWFTYSLFQKLSKMLPVQANIISEHSECGFLRVWCCTRTCFRRQWDAAAWHVCDSIWCVKKHTTLLPIPPIVWFPYRHQRKHSLFFHLSVNTMRSACTFSNSVPWIMYIFCVDSCSWFFLLWLWILTQIYYFFTATLSLNEFWFALFLHINYLAEDYLTGEDW